MPAYHPKSPAAVAAQRSPRIPRTLTDAERRRMRDAVEAGGTYREVARRFGVSVAFVSEALQRIPGAPSSANAAAQGNASGEGATR